MNPPSDTFFRRFSHALGSAGVLVFFSEYFFGNEGPARHGIEGLPADPVATLVGVGELVGYYVLFTYVFLVAMDRYRVRDAGGLVLAGCLFGWATEATVVPAAYEAMPFSFFWTSVCWHALVDVGLGWFLIRRALRRASGRVIAGGAVQVVMFGGYLLVGLVALAVAGLRRRAGSADAPGWLDDPRPPPPAARYLALFACPLAAAGTYGGLRGGAIVPEYELLLLPLLVAGPVAFLAALVGPVRRDLPAEGPVTDPT